MYRIEGASCRNMYDLILGVKNAKADVTLLQRIWVF
jgi:hypothetical protein